MANKLHIKMGQIEFEIEGDSSLIERERENFFIMLPQVVSAISPVMPIPTQIDSPQEEEPFPYILPDVSTGLTQEVVPENKFESLAEFLKTKRFSTGVEIVMGVAYYLQFVQGITSITSKDVEQILDNERQNKPKNISQNLIQNIKKGYLREEKEKKDGLKAYCVLERGKNWCENYEPSVNEQKKKSSKPKATKFKEESSLLSISVDELHVEEYCDITQLTKFNEQMLVLMLMYTREKGIEYFSSNDIVSVLKIKFKIPATDRKVRYAFDKGGIMFDKKVEKKVSYYKLMTGGIKAAERIIAEQKADINVD